MWDGFRGGLAGAWDRFLSDRSVALWSVLAGVAAVIAVILALTRPDDDPVVVPVPTPPASSAAPAAGRPDLKLAAFAADRTAEIDATVDDPGDGPPRSPATDRVRVAGAVLDVSLRNDGDLPSLVTGIRVTLRRADALEPCLPSGGMSVVSARYTVAFPVPPPDPPTRLDRPVRFEILPHSLDRLTVSVGPEESSGIQGFVYVVDVELVHDGGRRLTAGRAVVVAPPHFAPPPDLPLDTACVRRMRAALDAAAASGGEVSPQVAKLAETYARAPTTVYPS